MPKIRQAKPRRGAKKTGKTTSFRVKLDGLVTPAELRVMLNEAVDRLEALGATHPAPKRHAFRIANRQLTPFLDVGPLSDPT